MSNKKQTKFVKPNQDYIPEGDSTLLDKNIEELGLSEYTLSKLKGVEICKIIDICRCQMKHLYKIPGMNKKNIFEVLKKLQNVGLDFKRSAVLGTVMEDQPAENVAKSKNAETNKNQPQNNQNKPEQQKVNKEKQKKQDKKNKKDKQANKQNEGKQDNIPQKQNNNQGQRQNNQPQQKREEPKRVKVNSYDLDAFINDNVVSKKSLKQEREDKIAKAIKELPPIKNPDGLYKFYRHGKWGYKTDSGKVVIEPTYSEAFNFREGLACVELDEKCGYINKNGEIVIPIQYDTACSFSEGLASVTKDEKCGYIDKEGNVVFDFIYEAATSFENDIALVKKDGKWGYMDRKTGEIRLR